MPAVAAGSFTTGSIAQANVPGNVLNVPTGKTSMRLTLSGLDGSNTVKTRKRTAPGGSWADQTTYNSNQSSVSVTVAAGEEWQAFLIAAQPIREVRYVLSCEG